MTAPMFNDSDAAKMAGLGFRSDQLERRPTPRQADGGAFEVIVFAVEERLIEGDGLVMMFVPEDLDGTRLAAVAAAVTRNDEGGDVIVGITNVTNDASMLDTPITIDQDDYTSYTSATPPVIDPLTSQVAAGDRIGIDVIDDGTEAEGLMVSLVFA